MRVALVHDHLTHGGGAERVLAALHAMWPAAPTYTLLYDAARMGEEFRHMDIRTSFLQRLPGGLRWARYLLPLMPTATESHDLSEYDVVISDSSAFAKGVITLPTSLHICYCHTPTRYLWSHTWSYAAELRAPSWAKKILPPFLTFLRMWDRIAADRVDIFIANSAVVQERIRKYYRKESTVIYPPVDTHRFAISNNPKAYFLVGGRLVDYKRYDIVIEAFTKTGLPLKVFGAGPAENDLRKKAGPNIQFLGRVSDDERARLFADAIAFIHPHEEDFGITAVESMAAGRPVIAYRRGGAVETVIDGLSGVLFDDQSWEELADTVLHFDHTKFDPNKIRAHAETYSLERFRKAMHEVVTKAWDEHRRKTLGHL